MEKSLNWREFIITRIINISGYSAMLFVALIFYFLIREGWPALNEVDLSSLLAPAGIPLKIIMAFSHSSPDPSSSPSVHP